MKTGCLVVMQPTFMPWAGYFNLIDQASDFVFLDDVQLEKQSWQTRNRLLVGGKAHWMTVPVRHVSLAQNILETEVIDSSHWRVKFARSVAHNYGKHPYFSDAMEIVDVLVEHSATSLALLNEAVIRHVANKLALTARFHRSSELGVTGVRSDRLIALCHHFGAEEYLSPVGSASYLAEDGFASKAPARLRFQSYQPSQYAQKGVTEFVSHLSIIDVLANLGWIAAREYVRAC